MADTDWMWCYENPKDAAAEIDRLRAANEHNEQVIRACNQKISELELWGKDYREQIALWKARAGPNALGQAPPPNGSSK